MQARKAALRAKYLQQRASLSAAERASIDQRITEQTVQWEGYLQAGTVFIYVSTPEEISTSAIIDDAFFRGKTVCVPHCGAQGAMSARRINSWRDLCARGAFGIKEPDESAPAAAPQEIDLVLVPALACDRQGYRLGYGGGYYDRYLIRTAAQTAVLCAHDRVVEALPQESHDVRCQIIITERELVRVL